uniref:PROP1-like PPR domain-containing protein n=1 Tax=Guillardia theta TaxID=55529 RepID=A0A7S4N868_GUITH|mmetsp:Transcript_17914/g.58843  ORF Transcript_17914/g.58843 Transcript_17914/m.58843 type:complete len:1004 (+) Transcript_17914:225-3236(+)
MSLLVKFGRTRALTPMGKFVDKVNLASNASRRHVTTVKDNARAGTRWHVESFITKKLESGQYKLALSMFDKHPEVHRSLSRKTYNMLVRASNQLRQGERSKMILNAMRGVARHAPDEFTCTQHLKALALLRRPDQAYSYLTRMKSDGIMPNVWAYTTCIDAYCKVGDMEMAENIKSMMISSGIEPTLATFTTLMKGYAKYGNHEALEHYLEIMQQENIMIDSYIVSILIDSFVNKGDMERAEAILREKEAEDPSLLSSHLYASLIKGYGRKGMIDRCMALMEEMKSKQLKVSAVPYNTLISALLESKRMDQAQKTLEQMEEAGIQPSVVTYTLLIHEFSSAGNVAQAQAAFETMERSGIFPDTGAYNALLDGYASLGQTARMKEIFWKLMQSANKPSIETYSIMIKCLLHSDASDDAKKSENLRECMSFLDQIREENLKPSASFFNSLISACTLFGKPQDTFRMYEMMQLEDVAPDMITFNALMDCCLKHELLSHARKVWDDVRNADLLPNVKLVRSYTKLLVSCRQLTQAVELLSKCRAMRLEEDEENYLTVVEGLSAQRRPLAALEILLSLKDTRLKKPSPAMLKAVVYGCVAASSCYPEGEMEWTNFVNTAWETYKLGMDNAIQIHEDAIFPLLHLLMRQLELLSIGSASRKNIVNVYGQVMGRATLLIRDIQKRGVGLSPQTYLYAAQLSTMVNSPSTSLLSLMALSQGEGPASTAMMADPRKLQQARREEKINQFVSMLADFRDRRDVEGSVQVLKMMRDEGIRPNERIYAALIEVCSEKGDFDKALKCLMDIRCFADVHALQSAYASTIRKFGRGERLSKVLDVVERMEEAEMFLDEGLFTILFRVSVAETDFLLARQLVLCLPHPALDAYRLSRSSFKEKSREWRFDLDSFDASLLQVILAGFGRARLAEDALLVWRSVLSFYARQDPSSGSRSRTKKLQLHDVFDSFLDACMEGGFPAEATTGYEEAERAGVKLKLKASTYLKLIRCQTAAARSA